MEGETGEERDLCDPLALDRWFDHVDLADGTRIWFARAKDDPQAVIPLLHCPICGKALYGPDEGKEE